MLGAPGAQMSDKKINILNLNTGNVTYENVCGKIYFFYSVHFMITERGLCSFSKRVKPILFSSFSQIPKLLEQHLLVKSSVFFSYHSIHYRKTTYCIYITKYHTCTIAIFG